MEKTKAIIISVKKNVKISPKFINENIVACIHSDVGELLFSNEDSKKEDNNQTNCKIVRDDRPAEVARPRDRRSSIAEDLHR